MTTKTLADWNLIAASKWLLVGGPRHGTVCVDDDPVLDLVINNYRYSALNSLDNECLIYRGLSQEAAELAFLSLVEAT